jgi:hypothetical protein
MLSVQLPMTAKYARNLLSFDEEAEFNQLREAESLLQSLISHETPRFYNTGSFTAVFINACHWSLS